MTDRSEHLKMLMSMMDSMTSAGDGEAVNAFRIATKELERQGLKWRDIGERAFPKGIYQGSWGQSNTHRQENRQESVKPKEPFVAPKEKEKEREKERLTGFEIPPAISGVINIMDDDVKSGVIIIEVEGQNNIYGPMIAYAGQVRDNLIKGNRHHGTLRVRPPRNHMSMAQIVSCRHI
jgi:hypothetical protein